MRRFLAGRDLAAVETRLASGGQSPGRAGPHRGRAPRRALAGLDADVRGRRGRAASRCARPGRERSTWPRPSPGPKRLRARARGVGALLAERSRSVERTRSSSLDEGVVANLEAEAARLGGELADVDTEARHLAAPSRGGGRAPRPPWPVRCATFEAEWGERADGADVPGGAAAEVRGELGGRRSAVERSRSELRRVEARLDTLGPAPGPARPARRPGCTECSRTTPQPPSRSLAGAVAAAADRRRAAEAALGEAEVDWRDGRGRTAPLGGPGRGAGPRPRRGPGPGGRRAAGRGGRGRRRPARAGGGRRRVGGGVRGRRRRGGHRHRGRRRGRGPPQPRAPDAARTAAGAVLALPGGGPAAGGPPPSSPAAGGDGAPVRGHVRARLPGVAGLLDRLLGRGGRGRRGLGGRRSTSPCATPSWSS